jgi:uncharacterized Ntn-hydrolase superfamily protein
VWDASDDPHTYMLVKRYTRRPAEQLYHTAQDSYELTDLAGDPSYSQIKARLSAELDRWLTAQGDPGTAQDTEEAIQAARRGKHLYGPKDAASAGDVSGTFSIVAADPETGECGAAVASKYPAVGRIVPYARAGVGAFCTQHWHHPQWGERALDMLQAGKSPEEVLATLLRDDDKPGKRQLAIIDMKGRAANRNPHDADPSGIYWGSMAGRYYACQGNTLAGRAVITAMAAAYEDTQGSLADRLMAALVAGDRAGGDHRGRLAAGIRVVKQGVDGYWLELQVDKSDDAVADLARKYEKMKASR